ncbi:MAG: UDP-3-O-(3-hydroxymyristoyl)glucosamine N-acyltransferase [Bacteroidaceae bacterium]|nr:UDP-3-O-(3-hydroxymyristoyl)glucosamine N-acyltransferase [Bacteroidaceae bacterium]
MTRISVEALLQTLGDGVIKVEGPVDDVHIDNIADVEHTTEHTLDWVNPSKANKQDIAESSRAMVMLVDEAVVYSGTMQQKGKTLIYVNDPKLALVHIGNEFFIEKHVAEIHPTAIIDPEAIIGENVYIGPSCIVGKAVIGNGTSLAANVRIYDNVKIGRDCYIKEGAVIGGAGFGYVIDENGNRLRFPHIGGVILGNNVDIGSNSCIDRGALSDTIIEDYVKIANLCQIAHNVRIGRNSMIVACSQISGSCRIGKNVWIGPNVTVRDWRKIGDNALVGIGATVVCDIPGNEVWAGNPARYFRNK